MTEHSSRRERGSRPEPPGICNNDPEIEAAIRVDHAGEFGALRIYEGQLSVLRRHASAQTIQQMANQEARHFTVFDAMVKDRGVRPTALEPLWRIAGFALGAATAMLGEKAAMACTVAVEDVIDAHYRKQIESMPERESELRRALIEFRADELDHRDVALDHGAREAPGYGVLAAVIRSCCRAAIALSEKI